MTPALRLLMEKLLKSQGFLEPVVMTWTPRQGKKPIRITGDPDEQLIADVVAAAYALGRTHERMALSPDVQRGFKELKARLGRSGRDKEHGARLRQGRKPKVTHQAVQEERARMELEMHPNGQPRWLFASSRGKGWAQLGKKLGVSSRTAWNHRV